MGHASLCFHFCPLCRAEPTWGPSVTLAKSRIAEGEAGPRKPCQAGSGFQVCGPRLSQGGRPSLLTEPCSVAVPQGQRRQSSREQMQPETGDPGPADLVSAPARAAGCGLAECSCRDQLSLSMGVLQAGA